MKLGIMIAECTIFIWIVLVIVMLPVYFIRRKKNPLDENNTLKKLLIKSLIASFITTIFFCSGFIAIYFDEMRGIYK